jgi:ABC-type amino acid transport substrate-binding protein
MACAGTIAGAVAGLVLAAAEPVVIGTDAPFPDYVDLDANGEVVGFERDVMDEVCTRAALTCHWELANFDELIPGVMQGRFDVVLGGMAVTEERRRLVDFTHVYYQTEPEDWYLGRPGAPPPERALTAVQSGTVHASHLRALGHDHLVFATEPEVLAALAEGRVDLALGPFELRPDITDFAAAKGLDFLYSVLIPDDGVAMAVCKGNSDLLDSLNAALDAMHTDGTLAALESRWFQ